MLGKMASELTGKADICSVVAPREFAAQESAAYLLDGESPIFILKSPRDEYCFTGRAVVHVDGESATSKKRTVRRLAWATHALRDVRIETAGHLDRDVELKFLLGGCSFDLDVAKAQLKPLRELYKALVELSELGEENGIALEHAKPALERGSEACGRKGGGAGDAMTPGAALTDACNAAFAWLSTASARYHAVDARPILERYAARAFALE